jgi:8-oxo-dGTP pyrophosphatase MutT (NUDIX family)
MQSHFSFQYCQKLIILSADRRAVLLARRKGEADYDGTYSFIGGKMETTDQTLTDGMRREKNEEIGRHAKVAVLPNESFNLLFRKKDGNAMVLPHVAGVFLSGDITLGDEYSDYKWVPLHELPGFEPKIQNIPELTQWAATKIAAAAAGDFVEL